MTVVIVSPEFHVTIPRDICEALNISVGQKLRMIKYDGQIVIVPIHSIESARGSLVGIDTTIEREEDRI